MYQVTKKLSKGLAIAVALFSCILSWNINNDALSKTFVILEAILWTLVAVYVGLSSYKHPELFKFWFVTTLCFAIISLVGMEFGVFDLGISIFIGFGAPITLMFLGASIGRTIGYEIEEKKYHKIMAIISWIASLFIAFSVHFHFQLKIVVIVTLIVSIIIAFVIAKDCYKNPKSFKFWALSTLSGFAIVAILFWASILGLFDVGHVTLMISVLPVIIPSLGACIGRLAGY